MIKKILLFFLSFLLFSGSAYALDSSSSATASSSAKPNLVFPITELGDCADIASCKDYCSKAENKDACIAYAQAHNFYKKPEPDSKTKKLLQYAKVQLGCDSLDSCKTLCADPANADKCRVFAKAHLIETHTNKPDTNLLTKAKEALGCDSESSCKEACSKTENLQKCSDFAKTAGLMGGIKRTGPGDCDSEEACQAYCAKNPDICQNYKKSLKSLSSSQSAQFRTGIEKNCKDNPEKCKQQLNDQAEQYCKANPDKCKPPVPPPGFDTTQCKTHPEICAQYMQKNASQSGSTTSANLPPRPISTNPENSVKGISTSRNFFQRILDFLSL